MKSSRPAAARAWSTGTRRTPDSPARSRSLARPAIQPVASGSAGPPLGGFKYNPPNGGPADTDATGWIAGRANDLLRAGLSGVRRVPLDQARAAVEGYDFLGAYVDDLPNVVDLDAVRNAGVRIGADPLGGASVDYWGAIAERHGLDL